VISPRGNDRLGEFASRLWRRRGVRRAAFWAGLILQLAMLGATLGFTLTSSGDRATHRHVATARGEAHRVTDRDRASRGRLPRLPETVETPGSG
jgi:hypothetical protein